MFVCLNFGFSSHSRIFHSYGDVTITGEGLQILTYAWHLWPLSSEGSLEWHTYCNTGHPFIMVISEDPWHLHLYCRAFGSGAVFTWFRSVAAGIRTPNLPLARRTLYTSAPQKIVRHLVTCFKQRKIIQFESIGLYLASPRTWIFLMNGHRNIYMYF